MIKLVIILLLSSLFFAGKTSKSQRGNRHKTVPVIMHLQSSDLVFNCGNLRAFFLDVSKYKIKSSMRFAGQVSWTDMPIPAGLDVINEDGLIAAYRIFGQAAGMTASTTESDLAIFLSRGFVQDSPPCLNLSESSLFWQGLVRSELLDDPFFVLSLFLKHVDDQFFKNFVIYELHLILKGDQAFLLNVWTEQYKSDRGKIAEEFVEIYRLVFERALRMEPGANMRYLVKLTKYALTTERLFYLMYLLQHLKTFITTKEPSIFNWLIDNVILYKITDTINTFADKWKSVEAQSYLIDLKNHFASVQENLKMETQSINSLIARSNTNYIAAKKCLQCKIEAIVQMHEQEQNEKEFSIASTSGNSNPSSSLIKDIEISKTSLPSNSEPAKAEEKKGYLELLSKIALKPLEWIKMERP